MTKPFIIDLCSSYHSDRTGRADLTAQSATITGLMIIDTFPILNAHGSEAIIGTAMNTLATGYTFLRIDLCIQAVIPVQLNLLGNIL